MRVMHAIGIRWRGAVVAMGVGLAWWGGVSAVMADGVPADGEEAVGLTVGGLTVGGLTVGGLQAGGLQVDGAFRAERLEEMGKVALSAVAAGRVPGGVVWVERGGQVWKQAFGKRSVVPLAEAAEEETLYDVASLTKVVATTTAVLRLVETGKVGLDDPVSRHLPEFAGDGKEAIRVRDLLTHCSGLRSGLASAADWSGEAGALAQACAQPPAGPPGVELRYSDVNFIVLGCLVGRVSGETLDGFCQREVFGPLGMAHTGFRRCLPESVVGNGNLGRVAPTERLADGRVLLGVVHDPTARRMGGVAGHAGLFSTAGDLARFCRMLLAGGALDGRRILKPETVALMTSVQTPPGIARRGLGWDIDSPHAGQRGLHFPRGGYGHTGWTGPSLWIDPFSKTFVVFMTNRNHPDGGDALGLRRQLATLAAEAVPDFNFVRVPGALEAWPELADHSGKGEEPVLNGVDVLARDGFARLAGLRVGLVTNASGRDRRGRLSIDVLREGKGFELVALFSPEHGLRGDLDQEKIADGKDSASGLPVYSLYGERRKPSQEQLAGLDALVFDVQDVGCRFYTYISTLVSCMEAAAEAGLRMVVLDRVNPVGWQVEGPVLTEPRSFVGIHEIPLRHGMTVGELALMMRDERRLAVDLQVVPCAGGDPVGWFDRTGLPWFDPSPNLRGLTAALLYPGVGMLEFCKVSVGRGTDTPFEVVGAPWIDDIAWATALNRVGLAGLRFVPVRFTPRGSVHAGVACRGVRILVTDRDAVRPTRLGLRLLATLQRDHGGRLGLEQALKLVGDRATVEGLRQGVDPVAIEAGWQAGLAAFEARRRPFMLYSRPPAGR